MINLVLVGVYCASKNVLSSKRVLVLLCASLLTSLFVYSGVSFAAIMFFAILHNGDDYSIDIRRIKEEEYDMYYHD